jgi:hypothetical protein
MNRASSAVFHCWTEFSLHTLWTKCGSRGRGGGNKIQLPIRHLGAQTGMPVLYRDIRFRDARSAIILQISTFPQCLLLLLVLYVFYLV